MYPPTLTGDLRRAMRAWRLSPAIPLVELIGWTVALATAPFLGRLGWVALIALLVVVPGLLAGERVAYVRAFAGHPTTAARLLSLSGDYTPRMAGLGAAYVAVLLAVLIVPGVLTGGHYLTELAVGWAVGAAFLLAPAWVALGTRYWAKGLSLSLATLRRAWPACAVHVVVLPLVTALLADPGRDSVALTWTAVVVGSLWMSLARGATTSLYLRHARIDPEALPVRAREALDPLLRDRALAVQPDEREPARV